ncbi:MAG: GcrA family cell cycle regulator [Alphaproteobacteria bacterium]|nr:GcrA family cell cycle regulator [Alphaproteobacteria bacterium]MCL2758328.1 GcrA family cell cycle regulator [Alphaproteobacteria bacterium]
MAKETWSPVVLNKMKSFLARGLSTSEIGKKIGMSKNAVVGKLNRLGWNAKNAAAPAKKAAAPAKKTAAKVAPKKPAAKTPVTKPVAKPVKITASAKTGTAPKKSPATGAPENAPKKPIAKPGPKKPELKKPIPGPKITVTKTNSKTLAMHQRIIQHSLEMANLRPDQCRWPIGDPDSEKFHFCGKPAFVGKPYCYDHCLLAYQMQPPKKK